MKSAHFVNQIDPELLYDVGNWQHSIVSISNGLRRLYEFFSTRRLNNRLFTFLLVLFVCSAVVARHCRQCRRGTTADDSRAQE